MKPPQTLAEWLDYQLHTHARVMDFDLARLRPVAESLGVLRPAAEVITVGGTNGKGSTANTAAALLQEAGVRTGLYTSPHLLRYEERIRIDGRMIDDAALVRAFAEVERVRGEVPLTYFEFGTLAALWLFRGASVGAAVLEVGLGGRLDATNIVDASVAVLCSVGLDHVELLGKTRQAIGREKSGIFRRDRPAVLATADMPQSVWDAAAAIGARLRVAGAEYRFEVGADGRWRYADEHGELVALAPPTLAGPIQYRNAAAALAAVRCLPEARRLDAAAIGRALSRVQLPGRMQRIERGGVTWILDVAHNAEAAGEFAAALAGLPVPGRTIVLLGMLGDKDIASVVAALAGHADHWILAGISEPRGLSAGELQQRAGLADTRLQLAADVPAACAAAAELAHAGDRVVVCGSFHTVGPALEWLGLYSRASS